MPTRKIIITEPFKDVLRKINNEISTILLREEIDDELLIHPKKNLNYLDLSKTNKSQISYLTQERIEKIESSGDYWKVEMRYSGRPGSVMRKLINCDHQTIENFTIQFLSIMDPPVHRMEIVKGSDIVKYYYYTNHYQQTGSLGNSCMNKSPESFFSLYTENDNINMLVMLNQHDLVMGRALLWNGDGFKVMDRLYLCSDLYLPFFYRWAIDNGFYYKVFNNWQTPKHFIYNNEKVIKKFEIDLKNVIFEFYPYLDTFKWLDRKINKIYNYMPYKHDDPMANDIIIISNYQGGYLQYNDYNFCDETNYVYYSNRVHYLDYMDKNIFEDHTVNSHVLKRRIHINHAKKMSKLDDYIFNDEYDKFNNYDLILDELKRKEDSNLIPTLIKFEVPVAPLPFVPLQEHQGHQAQQVLQVHVHPMRENMGNQME